MTTAIARSTDFEVISNAQVVRGVCVLLDGDDIIYAGPIRGLPWTRGTQMVLHPEDHKSLGTYSQSIRGKK